MTLRQLTAINAAVRTASEIGAVCHMANEACDADSAQTLAALVFANVENALVRLANDLAGIEALG